MPHFPLDKDAEETATPIPGTQLRDAAGRHAKVVALQVGKTGLNATIRLDDGHEMSFPASVLKLQSDGTYCLPFAFDQPLENERQAIPVMQEQLHVGKQRIETGKGVRIHKTVVEREEVVDPALLQDALEIERVACAQMVDGAALPVAHYEGDTLVVPVLEEVLVVEKRMRVKEEIRITRRQREVHAPQTAVLKEEQVSVEHFNEGENGATQSPISTHRLATQTGNRAGDTLKEKVMAHTVVGVYDNYSQAQAALNELTSSGFSIERVNLSPAQDSSEAREEVLRSHRSEDEGITGSIAGFFRSLFGSPEHEQHADKYSEAIRRGSYLLTVHTDSDAESERATDIMNRHEPFNVDERASEWQSQGWSKYETSAPPMSDTEIAQERSRYASSGMESGTETRMPDTTSARMRDADMRTGGTAEGKTSIPVVQEELQVGKREVQRGGVRVYQHVTEKPVQEQVQLREEHVSVERHPVDQPATDASLANMKDATFEVRETAEEPIIAKTARVVEEVVVGKDVKERTETISDSVRRTDVEVEQLGSEVRSRTEGLSGTAMDDGDFRTHWQSNYAATGGRYEDYAPAYQYGSRLASDERYRSHDWNDVESNVRQDWESNNAGHPWERVKDAVRYGWNKMTR